MDYPLNGFILDVEKKIITYHKKNNFTLDFIQDPEKAIVIFYSHGTTSPRIRANCKEHYNRVPNSLLLLAKQDRSIYIYYLCSRAVDGKKAGSYISKRVLEIGKALQELHTIGVNADNIFLAGHSAGAFSSLMASVQYGKKFNGIIAFAPACCGPRSEITKYPKWRKVILPKLIKEMLQATTIKALIFAYKDDPFNRSQELAFLTETFPHNIKIKSYSCNKGHLTLFQDCLLVNTKTLIQKFILK